jgi:hypothetical protein
MKTSGESASNSKLDHLYYLETPNRFENNTISAKACDGLRAGDQFLKGSNDLEVNGLFAAVCVHGFVYHVIGISFSSFFPFSDFSD